MNSYVQRTQGRKLPVNQLITARIKELAGVDYLVFADQVEEQNIANREDVPIHVPAFDAPPGITSEEAMIDSNEIEWPEFTE